jgi:hypothetical protein
MWLLSVKKLIQFFVSRGSFEESYHGCGDEIADESRKIDNFLLKLSPLE